MGVEGNCAVHKLSETQIKLKLESSAIFLNGRRK